MYIYLQISSCAGHYIILIFTKANYILSSSSPKSFIYQG